MSDFDNNFRVTGHVKLTKKKKKRVWSLELPADVRVRFRFKAEWE